MTPIKFKLVHRITRNNFHKLNHLDNFNQKIAHDNIRKKLYIDATYKVLKLENKNFISKWWNNYQELKNLTENYTYLDIEIVWWEKDAVIRALTEMTMYNMKKGGMI